MKNFYKKQIYIFLIIVFTLLSFKTKIYANENTIIDVSNMSVGGNVIHNHIYKSMMDDTSHWTECLVCKEKLNVQPHNIKKTYTSTTLAKCHYNNSYTSVCNDCGYTKVGHDPCTWNGSSYTYYSNYRHWKVCSTCKAEIAYSYYYNGKLYEPEQGYTLCKKSDGSIINCSNIGSCNICKTKYVEKRHDVRTNADGTITCHLCGKYFGTCSVVRKESMNNEVVSCQSTVTISLTNGATFYTTGYFRDISGVWQSHSTSIRSINSTKTSVVIDYYATFSPTYKGLFSNYETYYLLIDGISTISSPYGYYQKSDLRKPIINFVNSKDINVLENDWILTKEITISGEENQSNFVNIKVIDENDKIAYEGSATVTNKKYSLSFIPKIEANEIEKHYFIEVKDANENIETEDLIVKKVDSKEPSFFVNNNENINYNEIKNTIIDTSGWNNSKSLDLYFKDEGIGNIAIGINNYADIVDATYDETLDAYKRSYTFIGDAYEPVNCVVYAKDGLGNLSTTTLVLDKIDNTKPTIEKLDKTIDVVEVLSANSEEENINPITEPTTTSYAKVIIMANDINERLGLEGSGITQYGIKSSNSNEIDWYDANEIEIDKNGTYYVYVKDLVGNISSPMILVVDELEEEVNNKVNVYVTQASTFSVKIPKVMILSGQTKQGEYKVIVEGNIGGMDNVSVKPDTILLLTQLGKDDILANVTQDKTTFSYNDFANANEIVGANGLVVAPNMTAGSWKGTFFFDIKFSVVTKDSSIGSIKEDANVLEENVVGNDTIQDKHTQYKYGFELK